MRGSCIFDLNYIFQSSILARFQNYSKLEETKEEPPEVCLDSFNLQARLGDTLEVTDNKKDNDLLGSLAEDQSKKLKS